MDNRYAVFFEGKDEVGGMSTCGLDSRLFQPFPFAQCSRGLPLCSGGGWGPPCHCG